MPNLEEAERRLMDAQKKLLGMMREHGHGEDFLISFQNCPACWRQSRSMLHFDHKVRALKREAQETQRRAEPSESSASLFG